jgi:hypothetical protein
MSDDSMRFEGGGLEEDGTPRPFAVARIAVSQAAEHLARLADRLQASEVQDGRVAKRILEAGARAADAAARPRSALRTGAPMGGTGVILMSRLAQLHRGRASVEHLPGGGGAFKVFLPAVAETDAGAPPAGGGNPSTLEDGAIAV